MASKSRALWIIVFILVSLGLRVTNAQDEGAVLLKFGPVEVTELDAKAELNRILPEHRANYFADAKRASYFLTGILVQKRLALQAREAGLDKNNVIVRRIEYAGDQILADAFVAHSIENRQQPDFDNLAFETYQAQKNQYQTPEQVKVSHILIGSKGENLEDEALELAEAVLDRYRSGESFSKLAEEFSSDRSVTENGGELGFISRGSTVPPFEAAAFALKQPGDVSEVIKSRFGFHIIKLEATKLARTPTFEELKGKIVTDLKSKYEKNLRDEIFGSARSMEGGELNEDAIAAFVESFGLTLK